MMVGVIVIVAVAHGLAPHPRVDALLSRVAAGRKSPRHAARRRVLVRDHVGWARPVDDFRVHEVEAQVRVRVARPMPPLPAALDDRVEALWRQAADRVAAGGAGRLFNGRVFSADRITPAEITGHMTEFRRIVAQMEHPALFHPLGLRPLAVCGVVCCADGVVVGRRPAAAVYQPGLWQLPPAGSVDSHALRPDGTLDLPGQLLTELTEELGLPPESVGPARPLCIVEHPGSHVSDFGMALVTHLEGPAVLAAHRDHGNREYDPLRVVPFGDLPGFIARIGDALVPPAREFLARLGLLPRGLLPAGQR
jgi:hypothetical protein